MARQQMAISDGTARRFAPGIGDPKLRKPKAGDAKPSANRGVLLTNRLWVRILFPEVDISRFEILFATLVL
jgi:hypothetical protein